MGVREVLGVDLGDFVHKFVYSDDEIARRLKFAERVEFYRDDIRPSTIREISRLFLAPELRRRFAEFAEYGTAPSFFKRIVDEISGHVYSLPPNRRIGRNNLEVPDDPEDLPENPSEANYKDLVTTIDINTLFDLALRLAYACVTSVVHFSWIDRLGGLTSRVLTPDMVSVIEDPDDCSKILGYAYQAGIWRNSQKDTSEWVFWDDTETFRFNEQGVTSTPQQHDLGLVPAIAVHSKRPLNCFWDTTSGDDLVSMQKLVSLCYMLVTKLHKSQGHKQLVVSGDIDGMPKGQLLDEEHPLVLPPNTSVTDVDLTTSASHYIETVDHIVTATAANYGINRDRINQKTMGVASEAGLLEKRQKAIQVARKMEREAFDVIRAFGGINGKPIAEDDRFEVDFAEVEALADRKTQLDIWERLQKLGLRNQLDNIAELNPELTTDMDRLMEYMRNLAVTKMLNDMRRETNSPADGGVGLLPEQNGAAGPIARDVGPEEADKFLDSMSPNEE